MHEAWHESNKYETATKLNEIMHRHFGFHIRSLAPCANVFEGCVNRTPRNSDLECHAFCWHYWFQNAHHFTHIAYTRGPTWSVCRRGCDLPTQLEAHTTACLASTSNASYSVTQIKFDEIHFIFYTHMHLSQFSISPKPFYFLHLSINYVQWLFNYFVLRFESDVERNVRPFPKYAVVIDISIGCAFALVRARAHTIWMDSNVMGNRTHIKSFHA